VSGKSRGKRVKVPVDAIPRAHTWLPDAALASGVQSCGCERAGGVYSVVAQDAKMGILAKTHECKSNYALEACSDERPIPELGALRAVPYFSPNVALPTVAPDPDPGQQLCWSDEPRSAS
jgi:hypothetical protein